VAESVGGLPNGQGVTLTLQDCNGSPGGAYAGNPCDSAVGTGVTTYGPMKSLNISPSANGPTVDFTVSVDPNGKPATVRIQTSRQTQSFTTGTSGWSMGFSDNMGYSATDTITVTVTDPGRTTLSQTVQQSTPAPPPSVTVSRGTPCGYGSYAACPGGPPCNNNSCAHIHVQTANFSGNVTCSFNSWDGNSGFVNQNYGPNDSHDAADWYGYPGTWVTVTCGGVSGTMTW
jgi:hypothetical protein